MTRHLEDALRELAQIRVELTRTGDAMDAIHTQLAETENKGERRETDKGMVDGANT